MYGQQPGAAYNGHYKETVYYPLVASYSVAGTYDSSREGHRLGNGFLHATLRQGQVHAAHGMRRFLQEVIRKSKRLGHVVDFRIDANEALLRLSLLTFNLASLRIEYEAEAGSGFDLGRFQRDVLKAGGRVVKHGRRLVLQVAKVVTPFWQRLIACLERCQLPSRFATSLGACA